MAKRRKKVSRRQKTAALRPAGFRSSRARPRARRNAGGVVIGDSALDLRYEGGKGKRTGKMRGPWKHVFKNDDVEVRGKKDGSVELRSKSGERLWDFFEV